jgi:hypothetical protein
MHDKEQLVTEEEIKIYGQRRTDGYWRRDQDLKANEEQLITEEEIKILRTMENNWLLKNKPIDISLIQEFIAPKFLKRLSAFILR